MGSDRLNAAFSSARRPTFVAYCTGGFPTRQDTVPVMLAMQECGVGVIEVRFASVGGHDKRPSHGRHGVTTGGSR
jgi:hypothetical protein